MQFVRNSYFHNPIPEPWDTPGVNRYLENIGRLCYRSDDKITDHSAIGFLEMLKQKRHWAMLEHYIFTISIPERIFNDIFDPELFTAPENVDYGRLLRYVNITKWKDCPTSKYRYLISGSATAFNYLWECSCVRNNPKHGLNEVCAFLSHHHAHLMIDRFADGTVNPAYMGDYDRKITFLERSEVKALPKDLRRMHDWFSVHLIVERSSTHDLVRHRPPSYGQESTRYCNYDKKGLCFIIPVQFKETDKRILEDEMMVTQTLIHPIENPYKLSDVALEWLLDIRAAADNYKELLNTHHMTPQEAKSVLPHALRAEINITTFKYEWYHIFEMRADKAAFPQIREVMVPLLNEHIHEDQEIFGDLQHIVEEGLQYVDVSSR